MRGAGEIRSICIAVLLPVAFAFAGDQDGDGVVDNQDVCCNTPLGIPVDIAGRPLGDIDRDCDVDLADYAMLQASFTGPMAEPQCCIDNGDCDTGDYCAKGFGDCEGYGSCEPSPQTCPATWVPVCGCDGLTYDNACYAARAGVSVSTDGVCVEYCDSNGECATGDYCQKPQADCDGVGECSLRPVTCPDIYDLVCGCDGVTYANHCYAAYAGVNVAIEGACPVICSDNGECDSADYCTKSDGDCGGSGTCEGRPTACPDTWDPVCGCDHNTYQNDCHAAQAGENVEYPGMCQ